jgi:hypothetical protein
MVQKYDSYRMEWTGIYLHSIEPSHNETMGLEWVMDGHIICFKYK